MSEQWKLCSNCGNVPMKTPNHTILCNTCHRELLPEIWQSRPLEDALLARAEQGERDAQIWRHNAENWYASTEKAKSMIERLIEAGGRLHRVLPDVNVNSLIDRNWQTLVAEYKEQK